MDRPRFEQFPSALILAAGRGNRLLPLTREQPKCLVEVGPAPLLHHQIRTLKAFGIQRIEVITGHGDEWVRRRCACFSDQGVRFTKNEQFETTTSLYSFSCANCQPGEEGLLILNSDVLFHPLLIRRLLDDPRPQLLLADFTTALGEEETKIRVDNDFLIMGIGKTLDPMSAQAESLGIMKVGQPAARRMLELARDPRITERFGWVPDIIHALCHEHDFHALSTGGMPWIEIDDHEDLQRARESIWPRIKESLGDAGRTAVFKGFEQKG
jgi:choline kinase